MAQLRALLVNDASLAGHHGSALVTQRCVELACEAGIDLEAGWDWDAVEAALSGRHTFNLVIVNGEGSIHHDSRSARRIAALAHNLADAGTPAYLVNASEEANGAEVLAGLAKFRLRFVRDEVSRASLARAGIDAQVVPDLTLSWFAAPNARGKGDLLVTDASDQTTAARLVALAAKWNGRRGLGARTISFRAMPPWPARGSRKRRIGFAFKSLLSRMTPSSAWSLRYAGVLRTRDDLLDVMTGNARGIVCGRYHAVCYALRIGLPFIAVEGNIGKVSALLADIGIANRVFTLDELEKLPGPPAVAPISDEEKARIAIFLDNAEVRARDMFDRIARDAKAHPALVRR